MSQYQRLVATPAAAVVGAAARRRRASPSSLSSPSLLPSGRRRSCRKLLLEDRNYHRWCRRPHNQRAAVAPSQAASGFSSPSDSFGHRSSYYSYSPSSSRHRWLSTSSSNAEPSDNSADKKEEDAATAKDEEKDEGEKLLEDKSEKPELLEFQAETRQLLDIVTHSLYTDRDVFLRELVSNASDSLEKLRHLRAAGSSAKATVQPDLPLEIRIDLDEVASTITITDTGIGMTRKDMVDNLGTIARSGSKRFIESLRESSSGGKDPLASSGGVAADTAAAQGIIGQFGVGFYSAFLVGETVEVRSRSAVAASEGDGEGGEEGEEVTPHVWTSKGEGTFEVSPLSDPDIRQDRGTSIVIHLKSEYWDYCDESRIEKILKRYSNFVNFPIFLNGNRVNTLEAIWSKDPKEVTEEEYSAFYKYVANAVDEPLDVYHFRVDAPLDVKALLFVPSFHSEKYGMGRMDPGVSLYSRKVLIESKSPDILPDWMRFVRGVVDSEDLPLSISREKAQDSALIAKLRRALVRKFIAHLAKMVKDDKDKYVDEFYKEYSFFLKEGICQDYEWQSGLSKLLYFETNKGGSNNLKSLDEYVSSMRPEQKDAIYYLVAPTRDAALQSPYLEAFEKANVEVLLMYTAIDDFVMANLEQYEGRKLISVEKGDIDLSELMADGAGGDKDKEKGDDDDEDETANKLYEAKRELTTAESVYFCEWFRKQVGEDKVASCVVTKRLSTSPAIVTDNESGAMRRIMRLVDTSDGGRGDIPLPKQHVEINPNHAVIVGMYDLIQKEPVLARVLADQVYDNCLVAAGLLDDSRSMLPRLNDILLCVVNGATAAASGGEASSASKDEGTAGKSSGDSDSSSGAKAEKDASASP